MEIYLFEDRTWIKEWWVSRSRNNKKLRAKRSDARILAGS